VSVVAALLLATAHCVYKNNPMPAAVTAFFFFPVSVAA
jgi:hypothetical protein